MNTSLILTGYKWKLDKPDELLDRILVVAVGIKGCDDQMRRKTRDLRTRFAEGTVLDGGIFENLL